MKDKFFYIPQNVLNISIYPDYPSGFGYIVDKIALSEIGSIINETHPKVWIDDAFLGVAIQKTNVSLEDYSKLFNINGKFRFIELSTYLFIHGLSPSEIYFLFKSTT